ncbi:COX assembly mitochondrial protein homolog [Clytia hemisphaerica]|uniref:COX assembly mitochondrial protein homolog n=1 Tax=Clytia hemisphaerica TaxID=252671 RepID=UPI0034D46393
MSKCEKMAAEATTSSNSERFVAPWATGDKLRKIEEEVLIPNLMKKKAKVICKEYMDSFGKCVDGRTISIAWSCGAERDAMKSCLKAQLDKPSLYSEARREYLQEREEFQQSYVETGKKKKIGRKESAF